MSIWDDFERPTSNAPAWKVAIQNNNLALEFHGSLQAHFRTTPDGIWMDGRQLREGDHGENWRVVRVSS